VLGAERGSQGGDLPREGRPGHVEPQPADLLGDRVSGHIPGEGRSWRKSSIRSATSGRTPAPCVKIHGMPGCTITLLV